MYGMSESDGVFHYGKGKMVTEQFLPFEHLLYNVARKSQVRGGTRKGKWKRARRKFGLHPPWNPLSVNQVPTSPTPTLTYFGSCHDRWRLQGQWRRNRTKVNQKKKWLSTEEEEEDREEMRRKKNKKKDESHVGRMKNKERSG